MNILYCIIASLLLCIFYVGGIEILEKYSKQENKSKAESARIGIKKLKVDIK